MGYLVVEEFTTSNLVIGLFERIRILPLKPGFYKRVFEEIPSRLLLGKYRQSSTPSSAERVPCRVLHGSCKLSLSGT